MTVARICPKCGSEKPVHSPGGLCPVCMLHEGLESDAPSLDKGSNDYTLDLPPRAGSVLATISATVGHVPRVLLRDTAVGEEPSPIIRPMNETDPTLRYRIDGEIARGGMGSVLRGRDPDIGHDVAIKVLREDLRENGDMVRRFVEEAQIGGQLQHPGVVPIYELGTFADKRPFFSMKLVKGQTLADLLAARSGPADDLPRLPHHLLGHRADDGLLPYSRGDPSRFETVERDGGQLRRGPGDGLGAGQGLAARWSR